MFERSPAWGEDKPNASTITLGPLSRAETATVVEAIIDRTLLPADTEELLLDRAGGNPLFAQEFVRMLVERGTAATLPETVQGIIAARVDGLSSGEKSLLQDAAVIGAVSWLGALCEVSGDDRDHVDGLVRKLERQQLMRRERTSRIEGEVEIAFTHALDPRGRLRPAPPSHASGVSRAGRGLVRTTRTGERRRRRARRRPLRGGVEPSRRARERDRELRDVSRRAHIDAARSAAARHDHGAVLRHTSGGLALDPQPAERAELLVLAAVAGYTAGVPDELALIGARAVAQETGHIESAVQVGCLLIEWANHYAGDAALTAAYEEEALRLAADLPARSDREPAGLLPRVPPVRCRPHRRRHRGDRPRDPSGALSGRRAGGRSVARLAGHGSHRDR